MKRLMEDFFNVPGGLFLLLGWIALTANAPLIGVPTAVVVIYLWVARRKSGVAPHQPAVTATAPVETFEKILARAKSGEVSAKYAAAEALSNGRGVERNPKAALFWYLAAADAGFMPAQEKAAASYESGCGVVADLQKALAWYRRAAQGGSTTARQHIERLQSLLANPPVPAPPTPDQPYQRFYDLCESEPERILLEALITQARLKPASQEMVGSLTIRPQAVVLRYRADFLVNGHLVVEVDGKAYHNNESAFESDRYRDQDLIVNGYTPIRFPASQIYRDVDTVVARIVAAASRPATPSARS